MDILIVDDEPLAREELSYLLQRYPSVKYINEAESIDEALEKMLDKKPDILFLDIHLTDENGFDLAKKLINLKEPPYLIFATAYDEYALKAFQVNASDYILKPFEEEKIHLALDKYKRYYDPVRSVTEPTTTPTPKKATYDSIAIQGEDRIFLVKPEEIFLVSVDDRQLSIVTEDHVYQMQGTLREIEQKLPSSLFLKTHRSYILNTSKIQEIQPWFNNTFQVTLKNDIKVPVSRTYIQDLKDRLGF